MATSSNTDSERLGDDAWTDDKILARIIHRVFPESLYRFASILLDIGDAEFSQIKYDARDSEERIYMVSTSLYISQNQQVAQCPSDHILINLSAL